MPKGEVHSLLVTDDVYAEYGERAEGEETEKKKSRMLMTLLGKGGQTEDVSPFRFSIALAARGLLEAQLLTMLVFSVGIVEPCPSTQTILRRWYVSSTFCLHLRI